MKMGRVHDRILKINDTRCLCLQLRKLTSALPSGYLQAALRSFSSWMQVPSRCPEFCLGADFPPTFSMSFSLYTRDEAISVRVACEASKGFLSTDPPETGILSRFLIRSYANQRTRIFCPTTGLSCAAFTRIHSFVSLTHKKPTSLYRLAVIFGAAVPIFHSDVYSSS